VNGECDELPEQAFYMVGTLEQAYAKAVSMGQEIKQAL
jgi:F-type H+-transporting ATPase subunit beta